jgi:hypothetical protein
VYDSLNIQMNILHIRDPSNVWNMSVQAARANFEFDPHSLSEIKKEDKGVGG